MTRLSLRQYRDQVRRMYDGPVGTVLALGSLSSLHEPLLGHMLRSKSSTSGNFGIYSTSAPVRFWDTCYKETRPGTRLVACDLSPQMLRRARSRMNNDRPLYVAADLMQLPFGDNAFDCVTCGWVLEHCWIQSWA